MAKKAKKPSAARTDTAPSRARTDTAPSAARIEGGGPPARGISRRAILVGSTCLLGGAAFVTSEVSGLLREARETGRPWRPGPFGRLRPDPDGILDLPEGFSYAVVDRAGDAMDDGYRVPARPDGMACFPGGDGTLVLLRNHENPLGIVTMGPSLDGRLPTGAFDPLGMGGVSRVVLDASLRKVSSNLVLAGTTWNCCGGPSPWGWLSCEEHTENGHGWVFACPSEASSAVEARPIRGYGRFQHEGAPVDPTTAIAYLTEDRMDGCLYRFVPHDPAEPFEGELQAMTIRGRRGMDTGERIAPGERLEIGWTPVADPAPDDDVLRLHARSEGAAVLRRGEGIALRSGRAESDGALGSAESGSRRPELVLCATAGGPAGVGQIFRLAPDGDGGELELLVHSESEDELDMPDNVTFSPAGHVFFCEDGGGVNHVRGLDPRDGSVFDFARNALSGSEIAGVTFSPDGRAMFVSLQTDGVTLAIRGPFLA